MIGWFQNGFHEKDRFEVRFFSIHYFAEKEELDDECYYPRRHLRNTQLPFESSRFIFEFILSYYYFRDWEEDIYSKHQPNCSGWISYAVCRLVCGNRPVKVQIIFKITPKDQMRRRIVFLKTLMS